MKTTRGQIIVFFLCLIPIVQVLALTASGNLSANPIQDVTLRSGRAAILLLVLSLSCTPLKNLLGLSALMPVRKVLGLGAFFYACVHFLIFAGLDFAFNVSWIMDEILQRLFIQIGLAALLFMIPLAITSIRQFQKRMGAAWVRLHRLAYPLSALAIWHYGLASKGDMLIPLIYGALFFGLMILRIPAFGRISLLHRAAWLQSVNRFLLG